MKYTINTKTVIKIDTTINDKDEVKQLLEQLKIHMNLELEKKKLEFSMLGKEGFDIEMTINYELEE